MDHSLVASALTSLGVSALTTIGLQTYLRKRIEHHFERRLERYKADLEVQIHARQEIASRRVEAYPKLIELCYRTRNMARDVAQNSSIELLQELVGRVKELEDMVFRFRVDLEADHVFVLVHRYKNLMREFYRTAADLQPTSDDSRKSTVRERLGKAYAAIDECYGEVVRELTKDMVHE